MPDEKPPAGSQSTADIPQNTSRERNAATHFGLEDHEATQQDARVTTLRHAEVRRGSMAPPDKRKASQMRLNTANEQLAQTPPVRPPVQAPTPERKPMDKMSSRSSLVPGTPMAPPKPTRLSDAPREDDGDVESSEPDTKREARKSQKVVAGSLTPTSSESEDKKEPKPAAEPDPPPPQPQRKSIDFAPQEAAPIPPPPERPEDAPLPPPMMAALPTDTSADELQSANSKMTNTDITIHPTKRYATKATNTSGMIYSDEEEEEPEELPRLPDQFPDTDLDNLFLLACREVKKVGAITLASNEKKQEYTTKQHNKDLVTSTDNIVEEAFIKAISNRFPEHNFIAEERVSKSETGMVTLTDEPTWIIDPIDGTMNYVHNFPYYCISVAYLVNQQTQFGIIYNPPMKNMYTAQLGKGAQMNGEMIRTTGQTDLSEALVVQEYSSAGNEARDQVAMGNAQRLLKSTHALRSIGSSAMGLAMVASGVADAYYNFGLHVWDMAAGVLIVTEAGGVAIDPAGIELDIMSRRCLAASTEHLALELGSHLEQNYPSPRDDEPRSVNPNEYGPAPETRDFTGQTDFPDSETQDTTDTEMPNEKPAAIAN
ncbi:proteoglycan 4 [Drosophila eugracilis]|uniref:proteoglycan 4 n=1 Tax=Drosophila eugracilis TaxID=29029 RepID=UPI001BDA485A|nr:proteoglycan 4 [Drosophila eugracilis]